MKKIMFLLYVVIASTASKAQDIFISTNRLGDLKINMPVDSVNKYIDKKIKLPKLPESGYATDTVDVMYKTFPLRLVINRYAATDNNGMKTGAIVSNLTSIYSSNKTIKTKSGIQLGDDKFDIIKRIDGSYLTIYTDQYNHPNSKRYSVVSLHDADSGNELSFYFLDNMLYAMECQVAEED